MLYLSSAAPLGTNANFGGFPGLREVISRLIHRFLPVLHHRLMRTITMPRTTTITFMQGNMDNARAAIHFRWLDRYCIVRPTRTPHWHAFILAVEGVDVGGRQHADEEIGISITSALGKGSQIQGALGVRRVLYIDDLFGKFLPLCNKHGWT